MAGCRSGEPKPLWHKGLRLRQPLRDTLSQKEITMREKDLESKLVRAVKATGGIALKFVSPNYYGFPDRLVLLKVGRLGFVEVKRIGEHPRPLQVSRHGMLQRLGFKVYVLDRPEQIQQILEDMANGKPTNGSRVDRA